MTSRSTDNLAAPRPRLGRPIKNHREDGDVRRVILNAQITYEMRLALEDEARRHDLSLSSVAVRWLEKGRFWAALERRIIEQDKESDGSSPIISTP